MALKKGDTLFIVLILVVLAVFFAISGEETTSHVPKDEIHARFYPIIQNEGKKAGEKFCGECHNEKQVPFPEGHPPKFRCLFCHKLDRD
ncbi:MAG: cytochrome c [Deltaproteobacteria bacterium]|nr:MAG: cytochrome c [Deltaproteobacteria bacterium]